MTRHLPSRTTGLLCTLRLAVIGTCLLLPSPAARADVFHLENGGAIEGLLLEQTDEQYVIRTFVGQITLPISAVKRIESAPTPFEEYDRRAAEVAETAAAQTELAEWCEENGLGSERRRHLRRAIELDADYAPAREALGHVRVGELWVDGRKVARGQAESQPVEDSRKLALAIQGRWRHRIRAIMTSLLESPLERLVTQGRDEILAIEDPLAVLPLAEVLSRGDLMCRHLLIDMLARFPQDESTLNLAVLALVDGESDIRRRALDTLAGRRDARVIQQYRAALSSDNDILLRRAAVGLGRMSARQAIPELIPLLTGRRMKWVKVSAREYFHTWPAVFCGRTDVIMFDKVRIVPQPTIGVNYGSLLTSRVRTREEYREVTVYRTEVLEALKAITGENFGFERTDWRDWYARHRQEAAKAEREQATDVPPEETVETGE